MDIEPLLERHRILPVLTVAGAEAGRRLGSALLAGGLPLAEVTLRTDGALAALEAIASVDGVATGVGTVVDADQVDRAVDAGAAFVVSPGFAAAVVRRCRERGVPVFPGTATATDMMLALADGLRTVKLFPAGVLGGPAAVAAYAAPFPDLRFVPTGGIGPDTLGGYLALPAVLAVGGSWLAPPDLVEAGRWHLIEQRVREAVERAHHAEEAPR
jgi:2-dehydro-3-deoxyphosphogluconate aldolase/(4S)-4-hydroxy-2-oxoglutarate aldolase